LPGFSYLYYNYLKTFIIGGSMKNNEEILKEIEMKTLKLNIFGFQGLRQYIESCINVGIFDQLIDHLKTQVDLDAQILAKEADKTVVDVYKEKATEIINNAERKINSQ
jgi:hypothetical protein